MYWFNWNSDHPSLHPHKEDISSPISFSFPSTPCIGSPYDSPNHSTRSSISTIDGNEILNHIHEEYYLKEENDTKTIVLPNIGQLDHNKKEYIIIPFVYYILEMKLKTHYKK
jgi:hypothetical protein